LDELNEEQRAAVTHEGGPLLVIAGAGTGKTAVITQRIAWLIKEKNIRPDNILALTFTEKAATEMEERVDRLLPLGYTQVRIDTFHGFCEKILRTNAIEIGLDPDFRILTAPEQWLLIRKHLFELPLNYFRPLGNPTKFLQAIIRAIGSAKDQDLNPEKFIAYADSLDNAAENESNSKERDALREDAIRWREFGAVFSAYEKIMLQESAMDFGDVILNTVRLFKERPSVLKRVRNNISEVLVDEFQDTNGAQNNLLRLMVPEPDGPISVVGDDDQSIYAWRGSNITNILTFQHWYPNAKKIVLTKNYRSTQDLLDSAYQLIQFNNPMRLEKTAAVDKRLKSAIKTNEDVSVSHHHFATIEQEASFIADSIKHAVDKQGRDYRDFAVLLRTNSQADLLVPALMSRGVVFHVAEARGLLLRPEVRDVAAYLRAVFNPEDAVSLFRVISHDGYALPPYERQRLIMEAKRKNTPLITLVRNCGESEQLSDEAKQTLGKITTILDGHVRQAMSTAPSRIALEYLQNSGYLDWAVKQAEETPELLPNLSAFIQFVRDYEKSDPEATLMSFLEYLDFVVASGESPAQATAEIDYDAVRLMTVHGAKGLEFPVVFLFGATSDKYPVRDRSDLLEIPDIFSSQQEIDPRDAHILEERRLFYVAMTRAKERLFITSALLSGTGKSKKKPSKFIEEAGVQTILGEVGSSFAEQLMLPIPKTVRREVRPLFVPSQISASQVESYESCPLKYKYNYVYKIPVPQHHALTFGIVVHAVLKELGRLAKQGTPATVHDALELYEKFWNSEGYESKQHELSQKKKGIEQLEKYLEAHPDILSLAPLYFEEGFKFKLDNITVNGRIDRVDRKDGLVTVTDFKTGSAKDQKYADQDLQLSVYAIALQEVFQLHADRLVLSYMDGPTDRHTTRGSEDLDQAKERVLAAMKGIQEQQFAPNAGPMTCQFCPFKTICDHSVV